jgi:hypothetical protein
MYGSLLEMVLAIALTGLIFASAIIPTTQIVADYQKAEVDLQARTRHAMAGLRFEQVAGTTWRDPNGPAGTAALQTAQRSQLQVGTSELREAGGALQQRIGGGSTATLVPSLTGFAYSYLLNNGTWAANPTAGQLGQIIALRASWTAPGSNTPFSTLVVAPDRRFGAGQLILPQPNTSQAYRRSNYVRNLTYTLGRWP